MKYAKCVLYSLINNAINHIHKYIYTVWLDILIFIYVSMETDTLIFPILHIYVFFLINHPGYTLWLDDDASEAVLHSLSTSFAVHC